MLLSMVLWWSQLPPKPLKLIPETGQTMPARKIDLTTGKLLKVGWLAALLLLAGAVFSPWGAIRYYQLSSARQQLETANSNLRANNAALQEEIDRLTSDPAYIEDIARKQHGLLRNNEFVYVFPDGKKSKH
jgi:cell division protein FtsB